jgi:cytochrome c556
MSGTEAAATVPHAVEAAHLREMMAELDYLATGLLPDDVESASGGSGSKRAEVFEDIEHAAVALAGTAADIPDVLEEVRLSADDRAHFRELAEQLRANAVDLQVRAASREVEPAKQALARITSTCDACHKAFRILPNALDDRVER